MADASQSDGESSTFKIVPAVRIQCLQLLMLASADVVSVTLVGLER